MAGFQALGGRRKQSQILRALSSPLVARSSIRHYGYSSADLCPRLSINAVVTSWKTYDESKKLLRAGKDAPAWKLAAASTMGHLVATLLDPDQSARQILKFHLSVGEII
ncbi:hypothetical protein BDN72DRAFT_905059 [Pluteus cervinus]|uniref:Uncharacterized protein n=1 Tax=Pluteus cervinus TaxID=181527 RepID=A0ACD3A3N7_9AGAR|nr:hypothetical protein BDN72DRAFT_905059 [Pluteus cervinus]